MISIVVLQERTILIDSSIRMTKEGIVRVIKQLLASRFRSQFVCNHFVDELGSGKG